MIDFTNKPFLKLKQNPEYGALVQGILIEGEQIIDSYKNIRDGVVFTDKRIIAVNVKGVTGKKKDFTSMPYKNIMAYSVETAGTLDLDSELVVFLPSGIKVKFDFKGETQIQAISKYISERIL